MVKPKDHGIRKKILGEIGKHPGIKISEIAKNSGISFQVVNKILKEPEISFFVKSTKNIKDKSNIMSFLTFETKNGEDEESIISYYEGFLEWVKETEEEDRRFEEEIRQQLEEEERS